ncbi:MAG: MerR family transcriptional regulator [Desulfobacterales bacterium]|nr:MerR family transcriptional regulator [Desulfobacterales bacterium]
MPEETLQNNALPDKLFFKVGEVSTIADVPAYVLRFWETEFSRIKPNRTPSGQRLYRKNDVELILQIKHLLYDKKFTIPGARQHLKAGLEKDNRPPTTITLDEIKQELESIQKILS